MNSTLEKMKAEAAKHGADTIILFKSEPELEESEYLFWSARTYKTQKDVEDSNGPYVKGVTFYKATNSDFPRYKGEVNVLLEEESVEDSIWVGSVYVQIKAKKKRLLKRMKDEAAKYGADTIITFEDKPERTKSGWLYWSAKAYRTQDLGDIQ